MRGMIWIGAESANRKACEAFIIKTYAQRYGAVLREFPENMMALVGRDSEFVCAVGLRHARDGFFSETYLRAPIDRMLTSLANREVSRSEIVEVTGLASRSPACVPIFLDAVVRRCEAEGFGWAFFTLTQRLAQLLQRLDLGLVRLGNAERHRVQNPEAWGSYYDESPAVFAVRRRIQPLRVPLPAGPEVGRAPAV